MSRGPTLVYFDANTLLTLAQDRVALAAVTQAVGDGCRVTSAVMAELRASVRTDPPVGNARRALAAAMSMDEVDTVSLGVRVWDKALQLRQSISTSDDHPRKHLGEATSVACAHATGGLVASDDTDARALGRQVDVNIVDTVDLLNRMVDTDRLTPAELRSAVEAMRAGGRSINESRLH